MFRSLGRATRLTAAGLGLALTAVLATSSIASADTFDVTANKGGTWMHLSPSTWTGLVGHANPGDSMEDFCWAPSDDYSGYYDLVIDWTGLAGDHWSGTASWISENDLTNNSQQTLCGDPSVHPPFKSIYASSWVHSAPFSAAGVTGFFSTGYVWAVTDSDGIQWALVQYRDVQSGRQQVGWVALSELRPTS